ncbi:MAG: hypothetical protein H0V45_12290 [Actinobacteria bacterium]|nr:hypothetical protein [Actinomycetota bacterium]
MADGALSGNPASLRDTMNAQALDEKNYGEVDVVLLYIEDARRRTEAACTALRASGAEDFLVEAMERAQEQLSETAKLLTQGTFFAVPKQQLTLT